MLETLLREDVELVEVDMCKFGMTSSDAEVEGLVRKGPKSSRTLSKWPSE